MVNSVPIKSACEQVTPAFTAPVRSSYGQILKSSAIVGSSSVVNICLGIVRVKVLALLLGPSGIGLLGLFTSIASLAQGLAGMGINTSGVRQIAESTSSGDSRQVARTVLTLRWTALVLGLVGAMGMVALSRPISVLTFNTGQYAGSVALLSLAVFFGVVSSGQVALIQGVRRIGDYARLSVLGALFGTLVSIPIVYFWKEQGIALFMVSVAALGAVASWWYARKVKIDRVGIGWSEVVTEASSLLKLGFAFMASGLMTLGTAYLVRALVLRQLGTDAAGFFQAAWAIGGLYVGFILQAMGADFFPRLTAVVKDTVACNRMVNEQVEVGLLVAVPGILGTLTFSPFIIFLFYSASFEPAVELLRWNCLGMLLRVASWPVGFILLARGERALFMLTETLSSIAYLLMVWLGISHFGLVGTGMAFFGLYAFCGILVFLVCRRLCGFRWSARSIRLSLVFTPAVVAEFLAAHFLPYLWSTTVGVIIAISIGYYSLKNLNNLVNFDRLPGVIRKLLVIAKIKPAVSHP